MSRDSRRQKVGILGGMGPSATQAFYATLIRLTAADRDQDHVPVIIEADPTIADRTAFLQGQGPDPRAALVAGAQTLMRGGATLLVMPCNTASAFEGTIASAVQLPIIPWVETAVAVAAKYGGPVGVLATSGTLSSGIYHAALDQVQAEIRLPTTTEQALVMEAIYGADGVKACGRASEELQQGLIAVAEALYTRGARVCILGCTELPLAVPPTDPRWPFLMVDPAEPVARRAIEMAGRKQRDVV